jgi:hypothetical protein
MGVLKGATHVKMTKTQKWLGIIAAGLVLDFAWVDPAAATTRSVQCSGDITSALNSAVASSVSGDTISISAGTCSMSSPSTVSDKNIVMQGAGKGVTIITADRGFATMESTGSNSPTWRITGISFRGTGSPVLITVYANQHASWRGPFRIDNLDVNYPNASPDGMIAIYGPIYGLIDHCDFVQFAEAVIAFSGQLSTETAQSIDTLAGSYLASLPYEPGSPRYLYVEDSTFRGMSPTGVAALDSLYNGGRVVFRYNTLNNTALYAHWTSAGNVNSLWWEVYHNTFTWTLGGGMYPMRLHGGGTGLIYNNTISGFPSNFVVLGEGRLTSSGQSASPLFFCDGTHNWDGNSDSQAPGWPCLSQTGRDAGRTIAQIRAGLKQASFPLYLWSNGPQVSCSTGGAGCDNSLGVVTTGGAEKYITATPRITTGFGNGDVDYFIGTTQPSGAGTHRLIYTPYTYPHPLSTGAASSSSAGPLPPQNVRISGL